MTFGHLKAEDGGRFPLTGVGDTNLFAYFAELASRLKIDGGRAGVVIPTGLVSDNATQAFAQHLLDGNLIQLYDFENKEKFFPIDSRYRFSLITMGQSDRMDCVFYAANQNDIEDERRHIVYEPTDIKRMNPNTMNCPIMRSHRDMEINRKIYSNVPVLWQENKYKKHENSWDVVITSMFHMTNDSSLFHEDRFDGAVPLYEAKLIHQYDDRFSTYDLDSKGKISERNVEADEKVLSYEINPKFWVDAKEVNQKWVDKGYSNPWVIGFRDIARATDERTLVSTVLSSANAYGNTLNLLLVKDQDDKVCSCLVANFSALVADYCIRLKATGAHVNQFILKQIPILPPDSYSEEEVDFIASRVAKLTRTHESINKVWLTDYPEYPFGSAESRLEIRAELDALYAKKYGLNRADLEFVLDPSEAESPDYPSETFTGLKNKELKRYGEFRTRRLVLEAFDKLEKYGLDGFEVAK